MDPTQDTNQDNVAPAPGVMPGAAMPSASSVPPATPADNAAWPAAPVAPAAGPVAPNPDEVSMSDEAPVEAEAPAAPAPVVPAAPAAEAGAAAPNDPSAGMPGAAPQQ